MTRVSTRAEGFPAGTAFADAFLDFAVFFFVIERPSAYAIQSDSYIEIYYTSTTIGRGKL